MEGVAELATRWGGAGMIVGFGASLRGCGNFEQFLQMAVCWYMWQLPVWGGWLAAAGAVILSEVTLTGAGCRWRRGVR